MNDLGTSNIDLRVLALCPTRKDFTLTHGILERAGIESICCTDLADLCKDMREGAGAVLIVEEARSVAGNDELSHNLSAQPSWSDIPVLVLAKAGRESARS